MNWVIGEVGDINPPGGGLSLDRDWVVDWLEGVRDLEEKQSRLWEIFHLGGLG
jgi:hypothetical protein